MKIPEKVKKVRAAHARVDRARVKHDKALEGYMVAVRAYNEARAELDPSTPKCTPPMRINGQHDSGLQIDKE